MDIKIKYFTEEIEKIAPISKGDWIDLRAAETVHLNAPQAGTLKRHRVNGKEIIHRDVAFDSQLIRLGVAMQLPAGFEASALSRSSTYKNFSVILANGEGVIDQPYCGDNDEWRFNAIALADTTINEGDRICQFRIMENQPQLQFITVDSLGNEDRGGHGSTGVK